MEWAVLEQIPIDATVSAAASGDEQALARLIAAHHSPMVRAAYVITGDATTAHEAAQNAWSIAWTRFGSVRDPSRIREWLVAICANEARQLSRRAQRRRLREIPVDGSEQIVGDPADGMGFASQGDVLVTDDPRMNGTRTRTTNLFSDADDNGYGNLGSSLVTIANDEGSWMCPMTFIHYPTGKSAHGEIEDWAGWCEGSGAYAGLKAYLVFNLDSVGGFISSGDGPPMPEAPAS
jgi:DNA-directed RNA polymerase specialized sigma24 family protein